MKAERHNRDKPELSQIFLFSMEYLAAHMTAGRETYPDLADGRPNWMLGGKPDTEYFDAAARHLAKMRRGCTYDDTTKTTHAAAVAWNVLAYLTLNFKGPYKLEEGKHGKK